VTGGSALRTELAPSLAAFAGLVDEGYGIIRRVSLLRPAPGAPEIFVAYAEPSSTLPLIGVEAANRGAAASASAQRAVVRACGESVERYCSAFFDREAMPLLPAAELAAGNATVIKVSDLYPFTPAQYEEPGFPFDPADGRAQRWVKITNTAGGSGWIPASCVYVPYLFDRDEEPFTHMPISTGLAAGRTREDCIRKGILEILERDALMTRWHLRVPAPRIAVDSCRGFDPLLDASLRAGEGVGETGTARWHLNLITVDVEVPIITAALIDDAGTPMTSVGVSADPDPVRALLLAVEEALLTRVLLGRASELLGDLAPIPATTLRGHMLAHARDPVLRAALGSLIDHPDLLTLDDLLTRFVQQPALDGLLAESGLTAWWRELTTADVRAAGLAVVRTIIPGLQPLDNDHRFRYLGGSRLVRAARVLGVDGRLPELNPHPHPFP